MSSFRYFEQIFKIRFRYNLMSVFQIFVLPIIIRAKKSWTKNKRCTPHSSLNLKRDKKSSLWCTNRKCTMMMKRAEKWPFPPAKNHFEKKLLSTSWPTFYVTCLRKQEDSAKKLKHSTQNIVKQTYNKNENSIRNYSRTFGKHFVKISKWGHRFEKCTLKSEQHVLCK